MASLPFVDELDWSTVDAILVTQYDYFKLYALMSLRRRNTTVSMLIMPPLSRILWKRQAPLLLQRRYLNFHHVDEF